MASNLLLSDTSTSTNNRQFVLQALKDGIRSDGRYPLDRRRLQIKISADGGTASVGLGGTRVVATAGCSLGKPADSRPVEGTLRFSVSISSMASQVAADAVMGGSALSALFEAEKELRRLLEQSLLNTRCVDREALCVIPGLKVWNLQVEVVVMEVGGNVEDAVVLAALAALKSLLIPQVETETGAGTEKRANVIDKDVKEAQPLHFHQQVFPVSFAVFPGEFLVVDPNADEEAASQGRVFLALTGTGRLCVIQKLGGVGVPFEQVGELVKLADKQMKEISKEVEEAISSHAQVRDAARIRRRAAVAPSRTGRSITILPSTNLQPQPDLEDDEEEEEGEEGRDGAGDAAVPHPSEGHSRMDVDSGQERQKKKKKRRPQEGAGEGSDWRAAASARRIERAGQDTATMAAIIAGSQLGSAEKPDLENAIKAKKPAARPSS